ncbi:YaiO family outer membrane beta-barrel protein [Robiginitalea sediminis]|uniref:YaiO family outer membrane beta-barrel protein n=1 Tax=Robiginitalea sediminis TaxID=1982593 RepID=UPI000B4B1641|nr:YaiO family outer membrane beta-barrel protein [Robiginitalea sediminis]
MKRVLPILILGLVCLLPHTSPAQDTPAPYDADLALSSARELAFNGQYEPARKALKQILADYPKYSDVENLLASTYSWDGDYEQARRHFNRVISRDRGSVEGWLGAIRNERNAGNPSLALGLANKALSFLGSNPDIEQLREEIRTGATQSRGEATGEPSNFIALENALEAFDQGFDPMVYGTIEYQRNTKWGKLIPRINYSHRFQTHGVQWELDAYPRLSKKFYAYLNYGYSNAPTYPEHRVGAEVYANAGKGHELSAGMRYLGFEAQKATLLTGSYGLYRGNYYLSFRPYVSLFRDRDPGFSGEFLGRRYLKNEHHYLGLRANYGFNPELQQLYSGTQLLAETLFFVERQEVQVEYQFTAKRTDRRYRAHIGVSRQEFVLQPGSYFLAVRAGVRYQIGF